MAVTELTYLVAADVVAERRRQEEKWGEQNHIPVLYFPILSEEYGEVSEAVVHLTFGGPLKLKNGTVLTTEAEVEKHYCEELVQLAAVAMAMVETILRKKSREGVTRETPSDEQNQGSPTSGVEITQADA